MITITAITSTIVVTIAALLGICDHNLGNYLGACNTWQVEMKFQGETISIVQGRSQCILRFQRQMVGVCTDESTYTYT